MMSVSMKGFLQIAANGAIPKWLGFSCALTDAAIRTAAHLSPQPLVLDKRFKPPYKSRFHFLSQLLSRLVLKYRGNAVVEPYTNPYTEIYMSFCMFLFVIHLIAHHQGTIPKP